MGGAAAGGKLTNVGGAASMNMSQSRRMDFIVWMDYTASAPEKSFGLLDDDLVAAIAELRACKAAHCGE